MIDRVDVDRHVYGLRPIARALEGVLHARVQAPLEDLDVADDRDPLLPGVLRVTGRVRELGDPDLHEVAPQERAPLEAQRLAERHAARLGAEVTLAQVVMRVEVDDADLPRG